MRAERQSQAGITEHSAAARKAGGAGLAPRLRRLVINPRRWDLLIPALILSSPGAAPVLFVGFYLAAAVWAFARLLHDAAVERPRSGRGPLVLAAVVITLRTLVFTLGPAAGAAIAVQGGMAGAGAPGGYLLAAATVFIIGTSLGNLLPLLVLGGLRRRLAGGRALAAPPPVTRRWALAAVVLAWLEIAALTGAMMSGSWLLAGLLALLGDGSGLLFLALAATRPPARTA